MWWGKQSKIIANIGGWVDKSQKINPKILGKIIDEIAPVNINADEWSGLFDIGIEIEGLNNLGLEPSN